jgi:hypothetical protein
VKSRTLQTRVSADSNFPESLAFPALSRDLGASLAGVPGQGRDSVMKDDPRQTEKP